MKNTLGLHDDDDIYLFEDLEASFAIRFHDEEPAGWRTVGDIFQSVAARFGDDPTGAGKCGTAMAFYRLRAALAPLAPGVRLTPETALADLPVRSASRLSKVIKRDGGLRTPALVLSWLGGIGFLLFLAGLAMVFVATSVDAVSWLVPVGLFVTAALVIRFDPWTTFKGCRTVGDLARRVAVRNFGRFSGAGARSGRDDLWSALLIVLADHGNLPMQRINTDTILLQSQA